MALGTEVRSPRLPSSHRVGANNQDMDVFFSEWVFTTYLSVPESPFKEKDLAGTRTN